MIRWDVLSLSILMTTNAWGQQFSRLSLGPANDFPLSIGRPSISGDGRFVAFSASARGMLNEEVDWGDVFVHDRQTGTTTRVSLTSSGAPGNNHSSHPRISQDGRFVAFDSMAALVPDDTQICVQDTASCHDVYLRDLQAGTTTRISVSSSGQQANSGSFVLSISADGRFVTFISYASNLVEGDTNRSGDLFLHDRQTGLTTRFSLTPDGRESTGGGRGGSITADGRFLIYGGEVPASALPRPEDCNYGSACPVTIVRDRETGVATVLSSLWEGVPPDFKIAGEHPYALDASGTLISVFQQIVNRKNLKFIATRTVIFDRATGRVEAPSFLAGLADTDKILAAAANGRILWKAFVTWTFIDRATGFEENVPAPTPMLWSTRSNAAYDFSANGRVLVFMTRDRLTPDDTEFNDDIYVYDRDQDGDTMSGAWETRFGLNPLDPSDAAGDADGDGVSNVIEFDRGSHPAGAFTRYLAEGATNAFFSTRLATFNPNDVETDVVFRFLGTSGHSTSWVQTLPPRTRATIDLPQRISGNSAPENDFSTTIESDHPVVVDRTMMWGASHAGAHAETSLEAPSTTWYLAEGATHGDFDLFYLLENPNDAEATVTINYLRLAPQSPVVKRYTVQAHSRLTIWVDAEGPELEACDTAAAIVSTQPIVVERAMYSSRSGQPFAAGHAGAAVSAPATSWFLAEGATGQFFDLYVLVANPGTMPANLNVTYLLPSGETFTKPYTVGPQNRLTIGVDSEDPRLADTPVSIVVEAINGQPVVVERTMLWPQGQWYGMHLSAGATATGTKWALAEGQVGDPVAAGPIDPFRRAMPFETFILLANLSPNSGTVTISVYVEGGEASPAPHVVQVAGNSRLTVPMSALLPDRSARFGTIIESDGIPLVVERAMYATVNNQLWDAGTASLATKLP